MAADPLRFAPDVDAYRRADHRWLDQLEHAVHIGLPHQRMGTRILDEALWLPADEHHTAELALRRRLVEEARAEVVGLSPGSEAAQTEAATVIAEWLTRHESENSTDLEAAVTAGNGVESPLVTAGLAVQEDLCLMEGGPEGWRFTAGILCFPTYWRLGDKLGRPQGEVHGPVPHYAADLEARVSTFFDRLPAGRIVTRRNWGFSPHPLLFVPDLSALPRPAGYDVDQLWLRSERQTLRKLPDTGAVLFTIKIQLAPATEIETRPALAGRLLAAMQGWSPELIESRGGRHGWYPQVCAWLAGIPAPEVSGQDRTNPS